MVHTTGAFFATEMWSVSCNLCALCPAFSAFFVCPFSLSLFFFFFDCPSPPTTPYSPRAHPTSI